MGYLAHIVLALVAQAVAVGGLSPQIERPFVVLALVVVPYLLAAASHQLFLKGKFRASEIVYRALHVSAPVLHLVACAACGWTESVSRWTGHSASFLAWPDWSVAVAFAPFVVYELAAIDARSRTAAAWGERKTWRAFQWRMFFSGLAPIATYLLIASLIGLSEDLRVRIEAVRLWNAVFAVAMLAVLGLMLPFLLGNTWETVPMPEGEQKDLLLSVAELAHFERPRLHVWKTGHTLANAAIVGVTPRSRIVLFSDSLLAQMGPSELAAVFAHEMGHAFRRHVPIFITWVLAFFMLADLIAEALFPNEPYWAGATVVVTMVGWFFSFGWLSRRFELDADLFSLDLLGETRSLISALERVGGRLRDVGSWRHFSTKARVEFLERAQADPNVGRRLRRDLRRWTWVGIALFVVTATLQVQRLVAALPEDRVQAELRLGHYDLASERAARLENIDPKLAALVKRAQLLGDRPATPAALAAAALDAVHALDRTATIEWLELGALRGDEEMAELADALEVSAPLVAFEPSVELQRRLNAIATRPAKVR